MTPKRYRLPKEQLANLEKKAFSIVAAANESYGPGLRNVPLGAAREVVRRSWRGSNLRPYSLREHRALTELSHFIALYQKNKVVSGRARHTDLLPLGHPRCSRQSELSTTALLQREAAWLASDSRIVDAEVRSLVAAAYIAERDSPEYLYLSARLESLKSLGVPSSVVVAAIGDGNSSAARRARAMLQRRDRYGRFAYMGGNIRALIRMLDGTIRALNAKIVAAAPGENMIDVETPDGKIYRVPASSGEVVKALLPSQRTKDGFSPESVTYDSSDPIIDIADLTQVEAPEGWSRDPDWDGMVGDGAMYGEDRVVGVQYENGDIGVIKYEAGSPEAREKFEQIKERWEGMSEEERARTGLTVSSLDGDQELNEDAPVYLLTDKDGPAVEDITAAVQSWSEVQDIAGRDDDDSDLEAEEPVAQLPDEQPDYSIDELRVDEEEGYHRVDPDEPYKPVGATDGQEHPDYTDDPFALATMFTDDELLNSLRQAVAPDPETGDEAPGYGALNFNSEATSEDEEVLEWTPAEAIAQAMKIRNMPVDLILQDIYNGNDGVLEDENDYQRVIDQYNELWEVPTDGEEVARLPEGGSDLSNPEEVAQRIQDLKDALARAAESADVEPDSGLKDSGIYGDAENAIDSIGDIINRGGSVEEVDKLWEEVSQILTDSGVGPGSEGDATPELLEKLEDLRNEYEESGLAGKAEEVARLPEEPSSPLPLAEGLSPEELEKFNKNYRPFLPKDQDFDVPEGYTELDPDPMPQGVSPDVDVQEGNYNDARVLAENFDEEQLKDALRTALEPPSDAALEGYGQLELTDEDGEKVTVNVPGEALRDALKLLGEDTDSFIDGVYAEGRAGQGADAPTPDEIDSALEGEGLDPEVVTPDEAPSIDELRETQQALFDELDQITPVGGEDLDNLDSLVEQVMQALESGDPERSDNAWDALTDFISENFPPSGKLDDLLERMYEHRDNANTYLSQGEAPEQIAESTPATPVDAPQKLDKARIVKDFIGTFEGDLEGLSDYEYRRRRSILDNISYQLEDFIDNFNSGEADLEDLEIEIDDIVNDLYNEKFNLGASMQELGAENGRKVLREIYQALDDLKAESVTDTEGSDVDQISQTGTPSRLVVRVEDLKPGDILEYDGFVVEDVYPESEESDAKLIVEGYYPGHKTQATKRFDPDKEHVVYKNIETPAKGDAEPIKKPFAKDYDPNGKAKKVDGVFMPATESERQRFLDDMAEAQAKIDAARASWSLPEDLVEWKSDQVGPQVDPQNPVGVVEVIPGDLKPGDVTFKNEGGFWEYFVVESVDVDDDGNPTITGHYPGHETQTKTWRKDTRIQAIRNSEPPAAGDKPALERPKKPVRGEDESKEDYEKRLGEYQDAKIAFDAAKKESADTYAPPIDPEESSKALANAAGPKPQKPGKHAFKGDKLQKILEEAGGDPEKLRELLRSTDLFHIDFETDGNDKDEEGNRRSIDKQQPIQVSIVQTRDGEVVRRFSIFMNPEYPLGDWYTKQDPETVLKDSDGNPISDEFLQQQMSRAEALAQIMEVIGDDAILVGHNIEGFDRKVLERMAAEAGVELSLGGTIDTLELARAIHRDNELPNHKLEAVAAAHGAAGPDTNWHDATTDTEVLPAILDGLLDRMVAGDAPEQLDKKEAEKRFKELNKEYSAASKAHKNKQVELIVAPAVANAFNGGEVPTLDELINQAASQEKLDFDTVSPTTEIPSSAVESKNPIVESVLGDSISNDWVDDDENTTDLGKVAVGDWKPGDFIQAKHGGWEEIVSIEDDPDDPKRVKLIRRNLSTGKLYEKSWVKYQKYGVRRRNGLVDEIPASAEEVKPQEESINDLGLPVYDVTGWTKVGDQKGSNEGAFYDDPNGNRYYVKRPKSEAHARNEALASALYKEAGVPYGEVFLGKDKDGNTVLVSPIVPGSEANFGDRKGEPDIKQGAQDGFVVDAWLRNWDSVGLNFDNMVIADDKVYRIDPGGSLMYRAQGQPKPGEMTPEVSELDSLRDPNVNPQAAEIFGDMTDEQLAEGAKRVAAISPETIDKMVDAFFPDDAATADLLKERLKQRRQYLIDRFNLAGEPESTPDPSEQRAPLSESEQKARAVLEEVKALDPEDIEIENRSAALLEIGAVVLVQREDGQPPKPYYVIGKSNGGKNPDLIGLDGEYFAYYGDEINVITSLETEVDEDIDVDVDEGGSPKAPPVTMLPQDEKALEALKGLSPDEIETESVSADDIEEGDIVLAYGYGDEFAPHLVIRKEDGVTILSSEQGETFAATAPTFDRVKKLSPEEIEAKKSEAQSTSAPEDEPVLRVESGAQDIGDLEGEIPSQDSELPGEALQDALDAISDADADAEEQAYQEFLESTPPSFDLTIPPNDFPNTDSAAADVVNVYDLEVGDLVIYNDPNEGRRVVRVSRITPSPDGVSRKFRLDDADGNAVSFITTTSTSGSQIVKVVPEDLEDEPDVDVDTVDVPAPAQQQTATDAKNLANQIFDGNAPEPGSGTVADTVAALDEIDENAPKLTDPVDKAAHDIGQTLTPEPGEEVGELDLEAIEEEIKDSAAPSLIWQRVVESRNGKVLPNKNHIVVDSTELPDGRRLDVVVRRTENETFHVYYMITDADGNSRVLLRGKQYHSFTALNNEINRAIDNKQKNLSKIDNEATPITPEFTFPTDAPTQKGSYTSGDGKTPVNVGDKIIRRRKNGTVIGEAVVLERRKVYTQIRTTSEGLTVYEYTDYIRVRMVDKNGKTTYPWMPSNLADVVDSSGQGGGGDAPSAPSPVGPPEPVSVPTAPTVAPASPDATSPSAPLPKRQKAPAGMPEVGKKYRMGNSVITVVGYDDETGNLLLKVDTEGLDPNFIPFGKDEWEVLKKVYEEDAGVEEGDFYPDKEKYANEQYTDEGGRVWTVVAKGNSGMILQGVDKNGKPEEAPIHLTEEQLKDYLNISAFKKVGAPEFDADDVEYSATDSKSSKFLDEVGAPDYSSYKSAITGKLVKSKEGKYIIPGFLVKDSDGNRAVVTRVDSWNGEVEVQWLSGPNTGSSQNIKGGDLNREDLWLSPEKAEKFGIKVDDSTLKEIKTKNEEIKKKADEAKKLREEQAKLKAELDAKKEADTVTAGGYTPEEVSGPVDWNSKPTENLPSLSEAISTATSDDTEEAARGALVLLDSDAIEDLKVRVHKVLDEDGNESIRVQFTLTDWAGNKVAKKLKKLKEGILEGVHINKWMKMSDGLLRRDTSRKSINQNRGNTYTGQAGRGSFSLYRANKTSSTPNFFASPNQSSAQGAIAFHNKVEIILPADATPEDIAAAISSLGIEQQMRPALGSDLKALKENKLIRLLASKTDGTKNYTGETRALALKAIQDQWGVTADDVTIEQHGTRGLSFLLPESVGERIADATGVAGVSHRWTGGGGYPSMGSDDEKAEWLFNFLTKGELLPTVDRWTEGVYVSGMSSSQDIRGPGAEYLFTSKKDSASEMEGSTAGPLTFNFSGAKVLRRLDQYSNRSDKFGMLTSDKDYIDNLSGPYVSEILFKNGLSWSDLASIGGISPQVRQRLVELLTQADVDFGGRSPQEVIGNASGPPPI